jgi:hypothetical protein
MNVAEKFIFDDGPESYPNGAPNSHEVSPPATVYTKVVTDASTQWLWLLAGCCNYGSSLRHRGLGTKELLSGLIICF